MFLLSSISRVPASVVVTTIKPSKTTKSKALTIHITEVNVIQPNAGTRRCKKQ